MQRSKQQRSQNQRGRGRGSKRGRGGRAAVRDVLRYTPVTAPISTGLIIDQVQPGSQSSLIVKSEYIGDVRATTDNFQIQAYPLNPGLSQSFPWLSSIASSWEYYKMHKFCVRYVANAATTTVGTVMLTIDYDTYDAEPASKVQMLEYRPVNSSSPWISMNYVAPLANLRFRNQGKYLTRNTGVLGDLNQYDFGTLFVATQDIVDTADDNVIFCGSLFVDYTVELITQQHTPAPASIKITSTFSATAGFTYNTNIVQTGASNNAYIQSPGTNNISFAAVQQYLVEVYVSAATTLTAIAFTSSGLNYTALQTVILAAGTAGVASCLVNVQSVNLNNVPVLAVTLTAGAASTATVVTRLSLYNSSLV
jgi:hypothetical protein